MSHHYTATATREGSWWMVSIPELDGLTQARRLAEAELMAREWIAATLDAELDDVSVDLTVERVGEIDVAERLAKIAEERAQAAELERQAAADAAGLAKDLAAQKLTVRDIGAVIGVSHQRAHQLVQAAS
ncbi:hypothetical protein [Microbacterium sp. KNMS]